MKILPDKKISISEYESMFENFSDYGTEGRVIRDGSRMIKLFFDDFGQSEKSIEEIEEIRSNKLRKLSLLYGMQEVIPNLLQPFLTYSCNGKFVGWEGQWFSLPNMRQACLLKEEIPFYLRKIREKLERFHQCGILYGDVRADNILIDSRNQDVIFVDIDNMQVGECPIDVFYLALENFVLQYGSIDWKIDSYMLNLLTAFQFYPCEDSSQVLDNFESGYLPELFLQKNDFQVKKLVREMVLVDRNYSGKYFIDMI